MKKQFLTMLTAVVLAVGCVSGCTKTSKTKKLVDAAKKYGLSEAANRKESIDVAVGAGTSGANYFVSKDKDDMFYVCLGLCGVQDVDADEVAVCAKADFNTENHYFYRLVLVDAKNEKEAQKIYDARSSEISFLDNSSSGTKNGYTYAIGYYGDEAKTCSGIYMKDDLVIHIYAMSGPDNDDNVLTFFCQELELESPLTLKP